VTILKTFRAEGENCRRYSVGFYVFGLNKENMILDEKSVSLGVDGRVFRRHCENNAKIINITLK
jgi:hypothetical protein